MSAEEDRQHRHELERRAEREREHTPVPLDVLGRWDTLGRNLYERAGVPGWPAWDALSDRERRAWAACERFLAHEQRQAALPGPLRVSLPETPAERYERHVGAIEAALRRETVRGRIEPRLREVAEAVLAAAETGF